MRIGKQLAVADTERLDPALLPQSEADKESQLDQLRIREVRMEPLPESIVGKVGIPDDGAGVGERDLLALGELVGVREVQQLGVLGLGDGSRS